MSQQRIEELYEEASIAAAELVGPNSIEYDDVQERIWEQLIANEETNE